MKKRKLMIFTSIALMSIGFAVVSVSLYLNGNTSIGVNQKDIDVYFSAAILDGVDKSNHLISNKGKTITVQFSELSSVSDQSVLDYEITNNSSQYDLQVNVVCKGMEKAQDYVELTNHLNSNFIQAKSVENGKMTLKLKKAVIEPLSFNFSCDLNAEIQGRTDKVETVLQKENYTLSGSLLDDNNQAVPNATILIRNENVLTDNLGNFSVLELERGEYEIFYLKEPVSDLDNLTEEELESLTIAKTKFNTNDEKEELLFDNGYKIKPLKLTTEQNKTYLIELDANGGELKNTKYEVTENHPYGELPIPTKETYGFAGWFLGDIPITNKTIVTGSNIEKLTAQYKDIFVGLPTKTYTRGENVNYANLKWKVVEDRDEETTLVLASHYTTGQYGGTNWSNSEVKNIVNQDFLSENPTLQEEITNRGIVYDESSESFIRIPTKEEAGTPIANDENLPFWLMDISSDKAAYALGSGNLNYSTYSKKDAVTGYLGYGRSLNDITKTFDYIGNVPNPCANGLGVKVGNNTSLYAPLTSTSVETSQSCKSEYGTPKAAGVAVDNSVNYETRTIAPGTGTTIYYFTKNYTSDSTINEKLCACNLESITTGQQCIDFFKASCDSGIAGDGKNDLIVYYATGSKYASTHNITISSNKQDISIRPVITVRKKMD